jgi:hypothetical protein
MLLPWLLLLLSTATAAATEGTVVTACIPTVRIVATASIAIHFFIEFPPSFGLALAWKEEPANLFFRMPKNTPYVVQIDDVSLVLFYMIYTDCFKKLGQSKKRTVKSSFTKNPY